MRSKLFFVFALILMFSVVFTSLLPHTASANSPSLKRVYTVGFKYVAKYKGRLINAEVAFKQLQKFFDAVQWKPNRQYSFNRDVLHNNLREEDGYVNTPLGYAFGSCGASSLLNKMVKTAVFRDSDGKEKPVFTTVVLYWWHGDPTYEQYGATIYLDPTGQHTKDYVWRLNPEYNGEPPKFKINFDAKAETVDMTMEYSDEVSAAASKPTKTATVQATATTKSTTVSATSARTATNTSSTEKLPVKVSATVPITLVPTQTATKAATTIPTDKPTLTPTTPPTARPTRIAIKPTSDPLSDLSNSVRMPMTPQQRAELLTRYFKNLIRGNRFTVSIVPIGDASQLIPEVGVNDKMQTYVASAFKGAVALYFFENIKPDIWRSLPVKYWNAQSADEVPKEYIAAWKQYGALLSDVWTSSIWSENDSTGNILDYVYHNSDMAKLGANPIIAFNNWIHSIGVSNESGLRSWFSGKTLCDCIDERYGKASFIYSGKILIPNNSFSARDLAQVYVHLATKGKELGYYVAAYELLSTMRSPNAPSMIQFYLRKRGIVTASKDGFVGPDDADSDGYYISTDAGLIVLPDGKEFAIAFMAFDSGNLLDDAISTLGLILVPEMPKKS